MIVLIAATAFNLHAEDALKKATIKSSVWCETCEKAIHKGLDNIDGVKDVSINLEKKEIYVTFDESKTSLEFIRKTISNIGYDADDVKANPRSYRRLPKCCKNPEDRK